MLEGLRVSKNIINNGNYCGLNGILALMLPTRMKGSVLKWSKPLLIMPLQSPITPFSKNKDKQGT